jgi:hypothetical protein
LKILIIIVQDFSLSYSSRKNAALVLVNITGDEAGAKAMLNLSNVLMPNQQYVYSMNVVEVCMK